MKVIIFRKKLLTGILAVALGGFSGMVLAIDTDGDGLDDSIDTDDDGDGIPDIAEFGFVTSADQVCWNHNGNNGTSYAGEIGPDLAAYVPVADNISFGAGLIQPTSSYEHIIGGADSVDYIDAQFKADYLEVGFTLTSNATLDSIGAGIVGTIWGGALAGDYDIAVELSSDNFTTSTLLYDNGFQPIPTGNYAHHSNAVGEFLIPNSYKLRFYVSNEQNNIQPDNTIVFDDMCLDITAEDPIPFDTDADGIFDHLDPDSDNDGIPDGIEGNVDTDGDGIPDFQDTDSDNDGILDSVEAQVSGVDTDGDGIDDTFDVDVTGGVDADGDGIDDALEASGPLDTDGDGIPDTQDFDSDNDGIPDTLEPGDTDGDGIPDYLDVDSDNDGINDGVEAQVANVDTDGDGIRDEYDVDVTGGVDADGDGVDDAFGASNTLDTDGDGIPNVRDLDSDGDGIPDAVEAGSTGIPVDTDGDGVPDYLDLDSDNDGIPDVTEAGGVDTDGDGMPDSFTDINDDGLDDAIAASPLPVGDFDGDGVADHLDLDSDGDGLSDAIEAGGTDADGDGVIDAFADTNGDGLDDALAITPLAFLDVDGDGMLDHLDLGVPPVATSVTANVAAGTAASIALANSISDAQGDEDLATIDLDPSTPGIDSTITTADGVWTVDATGGLTFTPAPGFEGTATIPYAVADANGEVSAPATVSVTVAGAIPVVTVDMMSVATGATANIDLSDNLFDANNDVDITTIDLDPSTPGIESTVTTADGVWTVDATGALSFVPVPGFEGVAALAYAVSDDDGNVSAPANVTVTVAGATPTVTVDAASVASGVTASIDLSDNLFDANNDVDIATIDLDPSTPGIESTVTTADGVWTVDATGALSFVPAPGFEGVAALAYAVSDDDGNVSAPANVTVTVAGATPAVTVDAASVASGVTASIDLSDNLFDANNDVDIATIDLDPSTPGIESTVTTADGVWTVDAAGALSFAPVPGFEGVAALAYAVSDDDGNVSAPANVTVTVAGAAPVVTVDAVSVASGASANIDLSDNLFDANNDVDIATIDLDPSTPGIDSTVTTADGVWTVDATGALNFVPVAGFEGIAALAYAVSDVNGNVSAPANVTVTVAGATPMVTADAVSVASGVTATIDLSDNLFDANNDVDIATIDLDPSTPGIESTVTTADGAWTVDATGALSFVPVPGFEGVAALAYAVSDDDGNVSASANVTVTVAGAAPVVTVDMTSVATGATANIDLSDNLFDANNDVDIATIDLDPSTPGIESTVTTADGVWTVDATGALSFVPAPGFEGAAALAYAVSDVNGNVSAPANVTVTVAGATPMVTADAASVASGVTATIDLSDNLFDANNDVDIAKIDLDPSTPGIESTVTTADGVWTVDATGALSFVPMAGFEGVAALAYAVSDDDGNVSASANVTVTVAGATPMVTADAVSVAAGVAASVDLTDNLFDANNDVDITTIDLDPSTPGIESTVTTADGVWAVDAAGALSFVPAPGFEGVAALAYAVSDDDGNVSAPANVTVTVAGAVPVVTADAASVASGVAATIDLSDNLFDANNDADITTIDLDPSTPGIESTVTTADGVWAVDAAGALSFVPVPGFEGVAALAYAVSDDDGNVSLPENVTVTVGGATPVVTADAASTANATIATVDLSDNLSDPNNDVALNTIDLDPATPGIQNTITNAEGVWSVSAAGIVSFDPVPAFEGTATIAYTVSDDDGNVAAPANVSVTVAGATPVATADAAAITAGGSGLVDLSDNISDSNNDADVTTIDLDPSVPGVQSTLTTSDGIWTIDPAGLLNFTPVTGFQGVAELDYIVSDNAGNVSLPATVTVSVGSASPIADSESVITVQNVDVVIDVLAGDVDANNDINAASIDLDPATAGPQYTVVIAGEGIFNLVANKVVFDPEADFSGVSSIDYTVSDVQNNVSNVASVTVTVEADNDGDGISDLNDLDDDNDGIPDLTEGTGDTDGDGIPDSLDLDSDNDGLTDALEAGGIDADGDGIIDSLTDTDGDGLNDATAVAPLPVTDTDGNGVADYLEQDSDADGIPDTLEAGADFTSGLAPAPADTDGDGTPDYLEQDSDSDGIPDTLEAGPNPAAPADTDGDGTPDYLEQDSDSDGIPDTLEAGPNPAAPVDTDNDGTPDYLELDSDGDGTPDTVEAGDNPTAPVDSDGDGTPDYLEVDPVDPVDPTDPVEQAEPVGPTATVDADGDGIPDAIEGLDDTDGDGIPDFEDLDSDNDGISDSTETATDTDADGVEDFRDLDADNDGIFDLIEARIGQIEVNQLDTDNDGIIDISNPYGGNGMADIVETSVDSGTEKYVLPDVDGDGVLDFRDLDSDNDGLLDANESDHEDDNLNGIIDTVAQVTPTTERRTILAVDDAGLAADAGGLPRNTDADGLADFRDGDSDNDGIMDAVESFGAGADTDNDGMLDDFIDTDGDGVNDAWLAAPQAPADSDGDGIADAIEIDSDGDGITDIVESGSIDIDGDGVIDGFDDADGDGVDDTVAVVPTVIVDTDGDGTPDFQELDSDNDGLSDLQEVGGVDADGDGQADELVSAADLIDTDGDGTPDFQEADGVDPVAETPEVAAATGLIRTGLEGSGCAISPTLLTNGQGPEKVDPMLPMLSVLALMGLAIRRRAVKVSKGAGKAASVAAVAIGSLFLGGCASFSGMSDGVSGVFSSDDQASFTSDEFDRDYEDQFSIGLYAVAGIGPSRMEPDTSEVEGWDPNDRVEPAGQITIGADLTKHFSIEAHSADLGSAGLSAPGVGEEGRINYHVNGISALVYAGGNRDRYRRQGLTAFGRVGFGALENTPVGDVPFEQVNSTHFLIGAGVEYMTPIGVGVRFEGVSFDKDAQYAQLGLMYRTGRKQEVVRPKLAQAPVAEPVVAAAVAPPPPPPPPPVIPQPQPVVNLCAGIDGVLEGVNFHTDSADLTSESTEILDEVAYKLSTCKDMQIEISAHTDSVGAESYNYSLSERRAKSVAQYLNTYGLSRDRLTATAFGESSPIDSNATKEGRARNRRVELYAR